MGGENNDRKSKQWFAVGFDFIWFDSLKEHFKVNKLLNYTL